MGYFNRFLSGALNPLVPELLNINPFAKICLKKEGIMENISLERSVYESVDDKNLSYDASQYLFDGKKSFRH